jgi:hypothetical protein
MAQYTVSSIPLAPIKDVHGGTGHHTGTRWLVDPSSVPPSAPPPGLGLLRFSQKKVAVTTMLFQLNDVNGPAVNAVPNWFGVAIPDSVSDFTRANIFFHPEPAQAGYKDSDYKTKSGKWPQLFYYMERLGYQLDGARRNQIVIMPFLTQARTDTGILPANWSDIVTGILTAVQATMGGGNTPVQISQIVVSSFSIGIVYSDSFRKRASLSPFLSEVWDFDGLFSTASNLSKNLHNTAEYSVIKYDQLVSTDPSSYHVPQARWANYVTPPKSPGQVHPLIRDTMFMHACSVTTVGSIIGPGGPPVTAPAKPPVRVPSAGPPAAPPGTHVTPPGTHVIPPGRPPVSPPGTHVTPPGTHVSPPGTHVTPPGTHVTPGVPAAPGAPAVPAAPGAPRPAPSLAPVTPGAPQVTPSLPPVTPGAPQITPSPAPVTPGAPRVTPSLVPAVPAAPSLAPVPQVPGVPQQPGVPVLQPAAPGLPVSPVLFPPFTIPGYPPFPVPGAPQLQPPSVVPGPPGFVPGAPCPPETPPMPPAPGPIPVPPQALSECCCCAAIVGIVSAVATTATTAITAITAIASLDKKQ